MTCPNSKDHGRRTFCKVCIAGMSVASAGMVGFPVLSFLGPPVRLGAQKPLELPLDQLAEGQARYEQFQGTQIIVLGPPEAPTVLSASCPHLGCNVNWETAEMVFRCPCHGAVYDPTGAVISGPVSAPLKKIPFEIKDGKLIVT
jgi:cytochrome b6-f complex iron-sulfur subunit